MNHQGEELKIIDGCIDVGEGADDTREIVESFSKLKTDHAKLMIEREKSQLNYQGKLKETQIELD